MGQRGPVPKRSTERRRRNKESEPELVPALMAKVTPPPADDSWHPIALDWYESLKTSGQSQFFEPSDWAAAQILAREMSRMLRNKFSSMGFAAIWSAMSDLLTTEADRRRVRMEIEREQAKGKPASVTAIDSYRKALAGGSRRRG